MCRFFNHQSVKEDQFTHVAKLNLNYFWRLNLEVGQSNESINCALTLHEQKTNIDFKIINLTLINQQYTRCTQREKKLQNCTSADEIFDY
jgi:hypothetical protein